MALVLLLAACGNDEAGGGGSTAGGGQKAACGTIPQRMPQDPDGVLAALPEKLRAGYNGLPITLRRSPWADWKPRHGGPYTVGVNFPNSETPFGAAFVRRVRELGQQTKSVKNVIVRLSNNDVQTQVQQLRGFIRQRVDLIIGGSLSKDAVKPVIDEAQKAGIPYVEFTGTAPAPGAIGFFANGWLSSADLAKELVGLADQKGRILMVHGIAQTEIDQLIHSGAKAVFQNCPDIEPVGKLNGQFAPPVAQGETLKFLSSNPQPIAGVVQSGGMSVGILQAFDQAGREIPPIADQGATPGFLAYWHEHKGKYHAVASGLGAKTMTDLVWEIAMRTLAGKGPKLTDIMLRAPLITDKNLDQWVDPTWTTRTVDPAYAEPPDRDLVVTDQELDVFFSKPGAAEEGQ